jgi:hypothetical protein
MRAQSHSERWPPPPADKNVTISNGGLSVTFNIAWGASVIGIANKNVADGLNIVDSNDVGRELQPCQFLTLTIDGREETALPNLGRRSSPNSLPLFSRSYAIRRRRLQKRHRNHPDASESCVWIRQGPHGIDRDHGDRVGTTFISIREVCRGPWYTRCAAL